MRTVVRALAGATSLFALGTAARAEAVNAGTAATTVTDEEPQTIVVTVQREQYGIKSTDTATRTNTLVRNVPQAMSVVSEAQIEDQRKR